MPSITPSLWFDHNLEEAVAFYSSVFPNSHFEDLNQSTDAGTRDNPCHWRHREVGFTLAVLPISRRTNTCSTRWVTSKSTLAEPNCCSRSLQNAKNEPASDFRQ